MNPEEAAPMDNPIVREAIDPALLTQVVRRMLQQPAADLTEWHIQPLGYAALSQVTGGVFRVTGHLQSKRARLPWLTTVQKMCSR